MVSQSMVTDIVPRGQNRDADVGRDFTGPPVNIVSTFEFILKFCPLRRASEILFEIFRDFRDLISRKNLFHFLSKFAPRLLSYFLLLSSIVLNPVSLMVV